MNQKIKENLEKNVRNALKDGQLTPVGDIMLTEDLIGLLTPEAFGYHEIIVPKNRTFLDFPLINQVPLLLDVVSYRVNGDVIGLYHKKLDAFQYDAFQYFIPTEFNSAQEKFIPIYSGE